MIDCDRVDLISRQHNLEFVRGLAFQDGQVADPDFLPLLALRVEPADLTCYINLGKKLEQHTENNLLERNFNNEVDQVLKSILMQTHFVNRYIIKLFTY